MPARLRRPSLVVVALGLWLVGAGVTPVEAWRGSNRDLYVQDGYERQVDSRTCTAASTAMMMNFLARRDLNLSQLAILRYEQPRDALRDSVQRGSDPLGWSRAATYYSRLSGRSTTYAWQAYGSARAALRVAARQIAVTGKPVGLLVRHGAHAVVMTGYTASADPSRVPSFTLDSIWVSDPYGDAHREYAAGSTPLNSYLQTDATSWYDAQWYGKYIVIVPLG